MAIFNDTIPSNSEPVKTGASRIREMKTTLNSALSQMFDDSLTFIAKWISGSMIQNDASDDSLRAIVSDHIKIGAIITEKLVDNILSADSAGRAKMQDGFLTTAKLADSFTLPDSLVDSNALAALAVVTAKIAAGAVTPDKTGTGVAKLAIGAYVGSNTVSATVSGLIFAPDFIILTGGLTKNDIGIAFRNEATANISPIHNCFPSSVGGNIASPSTTAIQWTTDGFVVVPTNYTFNKLGLTHSYLALKA